jgi:hypothetical protein
MSLRIEIANTRLRLFSTEVEAREQAALLPGSGQPVEFDCGWLIRDANGEFHDDDGIIPPRIAALITQLLPANGLSSAAE